MGLGPEIEDVILGGVLLLLEHDVWDLIQTLNPGQWRGLIQVKYGSPTWSVCHKGGERYRGCPGGGRGAFPEPKPTWEPETGRETSVAD